MYAAGLLLSCTTAPLGWSWASKPRAITRGVPGLWSSPTSDTQATSKPPPGAAATAGLKSAGVEGEPAGSEATST